MLRCPVSVSWFPPSLFQPESLFQVRRDPRRKWTHAGIQSQKPLHSDAHPSRRKLSEPQKLRQIGEQPPPVAVSEQVASVRPHLEIHQFIAAGARKHHATIGGDGAILIEQGN